MFLEMHDNEAPTLCAVARNLDYDYQAEQHVIDSRANSDVLVLWVLFDDSGKPRRAWCRDGHGGAVVTCPVPPGTVADPRSLRSALS